MTKKDYSIIALLSAILTGVFMYLVFYFPHELVTCLFWFLSVVVCFLSFFLLITMIWTKGDILPNPYPNVYIPDFYHEKKENKS